MVIGALHGNTLEQLLLKNLLIIIIKILMKNHFIAKETLYNNTVIINMSELII